MIRRGPRIYLIGLCCLGLGYGLGVGEMILAVVSLVAAICLLPGMIAAEPRRSPAEQPSEVAALSESSASGQISLSDLEPAAVLLSGAGIITAMNAAAVDLLGQGTGETVRLVLREPSSLDAVQLSLAEGREMVREVEGIGRGNTVYRLRVAPVERGGYLLTLADISPARAAERMRVDFVANASHELRTPLATLAGFIETLQGPAADDPEASKRFLGVMADEAARMTRLIDDLLSLSRIELDKSLRPRTAVDLAETVDEFSKTVDLKMKEARRPLLVEIQPGLPPVLADRDQLLQVLNNLVFNSMKYGRPETAIKLAVKTVGSAASISVQDEGDGIEAEHLPRLTERFYRVDAGRSRKMGGTGLGLAIVKHIVERHRGRLEIRSVPGVGTRIAFSVPLADIPASNGESQN
ncbi:ATP-binding protein [Pacificimonas sp. ICDLI1SI03]